MAIAYQHSLPPEIADIQAKMVVHAVEYGLDCYPTIFEVVDADQLHAIAAYGGFPQRYPHWRFGMEYEQLCKGYRYGLQKIYELVINNNPCYAYLLRSNSLTDQKLVVAHVYGHCDFFKNNAYFSGTNRKMMDVMANHASRVRRYMDRYGVDKVEAFIDACLSIEDLIDPHADAIRRRSDARHPEEPASSDTLRFTSKSYLDRYVNPRTVVERDEESNAETPREFHSPATPTEPLRDVMGFLLAHSPLPDWQLDVLSMIRDEAYYFAPQAQTKIMNEGWASYWHSTIMTRHGIGPQDVIHYCDHHAGCMATSPQKLNPYKLGIELFRHIEDRWNRGAFGPEYAACDDLGAREAWDRQLGLGREKIFEVRRIHNDVTFIDEFLTLEFCRENRLFSFGYNQQREQYEIESREFPKVKQQLLFALTNAGRPIIRVCDGNYKNRGELYLEHDFNGVELKLDYARDALTALQRLWTRPVHLATNLRGEPTTLSFDGAEHTGFGS